MKIIDSVAAVFCHAGDIFSVRRQSYLRAFPGYESFPGGKIDSDDPASAHLAPFLCALEGKQMHALVRELHEELGYDLPCAIASGQVQSVRYLATALAPAIVATRFRLHFFRIDLKSRPQFTPDSGEFADTFWGTPQQLLSKFNRGEALMVPPLRWVLEMLTQNPDEAGFGDLSPTFDEENCVPRVEPLSGVHILPVPSNTFPPVKRTNAFLLGDKDAPQVLVDPSPESSHVLTKLQRTLEQDRIDVLFLTHHHADHHEYAPELARALGVPIWMSEDTYFRIIQKMGNDYFSGLEIGFKGDGDHLTSWKGEAVRVFPIPGHDAGQLGLAPDSLRWFIVGDLIQGDGTVVISAPEGDMATYFDSLQKIIDLAPEVIIPSHGTAMRSTYRLRATLRHRREREQMIFDLYAEGKTETEIVEVVYRGLDQKLRPYATKSLKSHLLKLHQEGKI